ncbi:MAG: hypothetical protein ACI9C1_001625 [Candidatus Aldehydirespiratoraceae bacterium]|jgi:hypothetical protein
MTLFRPQKRPRGDAFATTNEAVQPISARIAGRKSAFDGGALELRVVEAVIRTLQREEFHV